MRVLTVFLFLTVLMGWTVDRGAAIRDLVTTRADLADVSFAEVVRAATGKSIVPVDDVKDAVLLGRIGKALDRALEAVRSAEHPAHEEKRINEVSRHFEAAIREALNALEGFVCDYPKTVDGRTQRVGYPDLRLVDKASGRVIYLDPKLFQEKSRGSSLRTFYFTPQTGTGKILEDAHHLLVGIAHRGKSEGVWQFAGWELVDLSRFRVRLKVEFQAGNRDIYREENVVAQSGSVD